LQATGFFRLDAPAVPEGLSCRTTSIAQSGHMIAHIAQPLHSFPRKAAGKQPLLFEHSEIAMLPFGQTAAHRPQPLQRSASIVIFPFMG
jgi:hypothetical protein